MLYKICKTIYTCIKHYLYDFAYCRIKNFIYINCGTKKYTFDKSKHSDNFLSITSNNIKHDTKINKIVYCFWTGDNKLTDNRKKSLQKMKETIGVKIELVTKENLNRYIVPNYPLHPYFEYLSCVHKSDYLRCYFMHHHGGGYSDIKIPKHNWNAAFKQLTQSQAFILGYPEVRGYDSSAYTGELDKDLKKYWRALIGNCAYIARPYTPFTADWYAELHRRMDLYAPLLKKYPGNIYGDNKGYPIPWTGILGDIFHPLCFKYNSNILKSKELTLIFHGHR